MRIHQLSVEAIGPFPGRHEIDIDGLSAGGLFLLEGPTGAGKSTLIDAITYGLYGTLGSKALDSRLPSAHAPLTEPVIEVVFTTGAGVFRVVRTPPYERPKKRGTGFTAQNATAKLWRLSTVDDDAGEPLAATTQEVGTEIHRILGLDRLQFSQTVVLPQGQFATFLRAKPDERAAVLRDVFGTAVYQQVQDELAEMARAAKRRIATAQQDVITAVRAFTGLLAEDDPAVATLEEAAAALDADEISRLSGEVRTTMQQASRTAGATQQSATTAERAAQSLWDAQRELDRNLTRRRDLLCQQADLAEQRLAVEAAREQLATGRRAATVAGALRSRAAAEKSVQRAHGTLQHVCGELDDEPDADLASVTALAELRATIDAISGEKGSLAEPLRVETALPERLEQLAAEDAALSKTRAALDDQQEQLAGRPQHRTQLAGAHDRLRRTATPVAAAQHVTAQCRTIHDAASQAEVHARELADARTALAEAGLAATAATDHERAVRLRWINSTAGSLAAELEPGVACPVCGGTEHPAPATEPPDRAGVDDVEAATERRQRADAALQQADATRIRAAEQLSAQQQAAQHTGLTAAEEALAVAEAEVATAVQTVRDIERAAQALADFDAETVTEKDRLAASESATATTAERLRGARQLLETDRERCRQVAGDADSVSARVVQLDTRLSVAEALLQARQELEDAGRRLADAAAALSDSLTEAGFPDAESAAAAQLTAAELTELEQRVKEYDAATAHVRRGLAEEAVAALTGEEEVDIEAAAQTHAEQHAALMAANSATATAEAALQHCERARGALLTVLEAHRRTSADATPVLRMGELATAGEGNAKATTLATFVLLRRFEDVVAAANDRLTIMSEGRFSLLRIDEREGRARRAGLGLTVRDHHTETNRDPHTLSGGETFYVSLCLALGLADVVTSEAGGITLDTLFIDEGFGSLDPHTLDGVLGELTRLQAGGRAVGIVSHVAELKDRIAERIEVSRRPGGGSTLRVRA